VPVWDCGLDGCLLKFNFFLCLKLFYNYFDILMSKIIFLKQK
jgi:hypothetical protein